MEDPIRQTDRHDQESQAKKVRVGAGEGAKKTPVTRLDLRGNGPSEETEECQIPRVSCDLEAPNSISNLTFGT